MPWTYVIADRVTGAPIGELDNAGERTVRHAFNGRLKTAACRIRLTHPLADTILGGAVLLKAYEDTTLRFVGHLQTFEEVGAGDGGSIRLNFADAMAVLSKRLVGKTATGYTDGDALNTRDKSTLITNLLAAANASAWTGVEAGTVVATGSSSWVTLSPYSPALDAITGIVNNLDGPDIDLVAQEPFAAGGGLRLGLLTVRPVIGTTRPEVGFEYGFGKRNVADYRRTGDLTLMLNRGYGLPPGTAPGGTVVTATDGASQAAFGVLEGTVPSELATDGLRQKLVDEHVRVRKVPRVIVGFTPTRDDPARPGRVPQYGTDFGLGDVVRFRAVQPDTGSVRVDALMRVYAVDWTIDNEGASVPAFTLTAD